MVTGGNIYILLSSRWRDGKREGWEEGGGQDRVRGGSVLMYVFLHMLFVCNTICF